MSGFKVITPPSDPVTLAEARLHLRVTDTSEDALITSLITASRVYCEHYTKRAIGSQTLELALEEFPSDDEIELPMSPVTAITYIKYIALDGTLTTLSPSAYSLDDYGHISRVLLPYNTYWPLTQDVDNAVFIRYVAGAATTPAPVLAAMKLLIGNLYENRESVVIGQTAIELPMSVKSLLDTYRIWAS